LKKYVLIYFAAATLIFIGFLALATTRSVHTPQQGEVDTVAINEIVRTIAHTWENLEALETQGFIYRFFIVNNNGERVFSTAEDLPSNEASAIRIGFLPITIAADERIIGTALFETTPSTMGPRVSNELILAFLLLWVLNAGFIVVLYMTIVRPFSRIQRFAHKISLGILDESLPISKNNIFGLFTQSFDIMRESLRDARHKQHKAERAHKELIASLSHDIKTPVTSIRLITELLQVSAKDHPTITEKLKTIDAKASQIDRLMNDMLHSALEELGELSVTPVSTDSGVFLDLFKNADHLSKIKTCPIPSCLVEIDMVRIEQVIGNIITNSYKYAGTDIDVSFSIHDGLQIDISDYGKGVESEEIELITTKFYRGSRAKTLQKEGEGLGLYVSKQLMSKMGGGMEVFNRDDGFTVRLWVKLSQ